MVIDIDAEGFLRRRRIIGIKQILPDIAKAMEQAITPEAKAFLAGSKQIFEAELTALLASELSE